MIKPANVINLVTLFLNANNGTYDFTHNQTSNTLVHNSSDANIVAFDDYVNLFPKCCSKGLSYDSEDKTCVDRINETSILEELGIDDPVTLTYNWTQCPVRIDRFVAKKNLIKLNGSTKLVANNETYTESQFCLDKIIDSNDYYIVRLCKDSDYCYNTKESGTKDWCIRKCCPENYSIQNGTCAFKNEPSALVKTIKPTFEGDKDNFAIFTPPDTKPNCSSYHYEVYYQVTNIMKKDGTLVNKLASLEFKLDEYCLEEVYFNQSDEYRNLAIACGPIKTDLRYLIRTTVALSCAGFFITILVYVFVYKLKKLMDILIVCVSVCSLMVWTAFFTHSLSIEYGGFCIYFAHIYHFVDDLHITSSNVLAFEVWRTFGRTRSKVKESWEDWSKPLACYIVYMLALPTFNIIQSVLIDNDIIPVPSSIKPELTMTCSFHAPFKGNYLILLFSVLSWIPIVINVVLYVKTIRYILKVKSDITKMADLSNIDRRRKNKDIKAKLTLMIKIGVTSGVVWISVFYFAIVYFVQVKVLTDSFYLIMSFLSLEGVYFFLIFGIKWKWIKQIYYRLSCKKEDK